MLDSIADVRELEDLLSRPSPAVVETLQKLSGDFLVLGAGGKMGPTLTLMLRRAVPSSRRVVAASRFSESGLERSLQTAGVETVRCDLLNEAELLKLPDAPNIVFMAGMKFGSSGQEAFTWAMNCFLPGIVCKRFSASRIVAFSTGNVYGLVPVSRGGSKEGDAPNPMGDYAMSCLGRERIFEHFSRTLNIPVAIARLNYAVEMRYGVLVDIATRVWRGEPVDLNMGYVNVIWQGDANAMALQSFALAVSPPAFVNVAGPEILRIRDLAAEFGKRLGKEPRFSGSESPDALLNDGSKTHKLLGAPSVPVEQLLRWTADWVKRGGEMLGKPTHFETRNGKF